ncbi:SUMF1/EgtB/PvdO family nonheme iron enzyme [Candidatus Thiodictyon syntrophicum]|uniref:SUMF1/EgtB/PvdO family nonheme iron enzyme n=1 Tax=Candidatus Thiodictyon syntrophicum TaxID=1166950 RepID=UPI003AAEC40B
MAVPSPRPLPEGEGELERAPGATFTVKPRPPVGVLGPAPAVPWVRLALLLARCRGVKGRKRVLRGGSWINHARNCRSANRNGNEPANRNENIGLRLSRAPPPRGGEAQSRHPFPSGRSRPGQTGRAPARW